MPNRSKIRWSQLKVGIVSLAACLIVATLIFLLTSTKGFFQRNVPLRTYMDDASGIGDGSPVRLNGYTIGYLDGLKLTGSREKNRTVEFDMLVQEKFLSNIPVDSVAGISAANLLGDKFINITKGQSPQHVQPGAELKSLAAQDIPELMAQSSNVLQTLQTIVKRLDNLLAGVEAGKGNIGKLLKDEELINTLNGITSEGKKLLTDMRTGNGTLSKLIYDPALYEELRSPLKRVDALLADVQAGQGTAGKFLKDPALYDEFRQTSEEIRQLTAGINAGKGTAGKLMKDEQLYQRLSDLAARLNATVDKMTAGQGTLGQIVVNPQLYESLTGATREFQSLAKDMRANPKKFLTIQLKLF